jgi:hypothetical protein
MVAKPPRGTSWGTGATGESAIPKGLAILMLALGHGRCTHRDDLAARVDRLNLAALRARLRSASVTWLAATWLRLADIDWSPRTGGALTSTLRGWTALRDKQFLGCAARLPWPMSARASSQHPATRWQRDCRRLPAPVMTRSPVSRGAARQKTFHHSGKCFSPLLVAAFLARSRSCPDPPRDQPRPLGLGNIE